MTCNESTREVLASVSLAVGVVAASFVPWLLLVDAKHLTPRCARAAVRRTALTFAALLLLLSAPKGGSS